MSDGLHEGECRWPSMTQHDRETLAFARNLESKGHVFSEAAAERVNELEREAALIDSASGVHDSMVGITHDPRGYPAADVSRRVQAQMQTHTRPVRLYDEPREEAVAPVNFQEESDQANEAGDGWNPMTREAIQAAWHAGRPAIDPPPLSVDVAALVEAQAAWCHAMQDADRPGVTDAQAFDADRPHEPTREELDAFWREERVSFGPVHPRVAEMLREKLGFPYPEPEEESAPAEPSAEPVIGWVSPTHMERLEERHRAELDAATVPEVAVATVGELIDRLSIVNVKMFPLVDMVRGEADDARCAEAARKLDALNTERSGLKNAITRAIEGAGARMDTKV